MMSKDPIDPARRRLNRRILLSPTAVDIPENENAVRWSDVVEQAASPGGNVRVHLRGPVVSSGVGRTPPAVGDDRAVVIGVGLISGSRRVY